MMKTAAALASAFALVLAGRILAADTAANAPVVVKDMMNIQATVVAIDKASRTVSLKNPKGEVMELTVDEGVTRFDALKVGDKVSGSYYEEVALELQKPGTPVAPDTIVAGGGKITGEKPGGAAGHTVVTTVKILAMDPAKPAVTVRTSDGEQKTYHVRHPELMSQFKVGDQVQVTKTTALLMSVQPAN